MSSTHRTPRPPTHRTDDASTRPGVRALYAGNHARQTLAFVLQKRRESLPLRRCRMSIWQAFDALADVVDERDPDLELPQLDRALQPAEGLRADGPPRWLVPTGFVHDLGKVLCLSGEPQWAVVGDTFPVGCAFSHRIVYPELFADHPDAAEPACASPTGMRMVRRSGLSRSGPPPPS